MVKKEGRESADLQTTLGEIIAPRREKGLPSNCPDLPFIGLEHIEAHTMSLLGTVPAFSMRSNANRFYSGDVLYGRLRPYLNKVFMPSFDGYCSAEFIVFPKSAGIDPSFLKYRLNAKDFLSFATHLNTGDRPRVDFKQLSTFAFLFPSYANQNRIVAKIEELFSELDKGVEALKTAQQQLKVYRQAVLKWAFEGKLTEEWRKQQKNLPPASRLLEQIKTEREKRAKASGKTLKPIVFLTEEELAELPRLPVGWCWVKNEEYLFEVKDGTHDTPKYIERGIPFITQKNIREKGLDYSDIEYISEENHKKFYQRSDVTKGDIIISMIGHNRGMSAIVETDKVFSIKNVGLFKFFSNLQSNKFSFYYYQSRIGLNIIIAKSKGGAQQFIGLTELRKWPVPVCSLNEQNAIVSEIETRLSVADKLEETVTQSLQQAEALRQSILKKAFAGQLVPQDPSDEPASTLLERIKAEKAAQAPVRGTVQRRAKGKKALSSPSASIGDP